MADTSKLFVNLGASQTRRRLKGFGHGVLKIETAGNNKAVIIHTATGKHLRQLEAKFADVGFAETETSINTPADLVDAEPSEEITDFE
jgi:DNA transformation protein and related proteins